MRYLAVGQHEDDDEVDAAQERALKEEAAEMEKPNCLSSELLV